MFPHPETCCQLCEMDRRFLLDRLAREHAVRVAFAEPASRSDRSNRHRTLPLQRFAPHRLGWLPMARLVGLAKAGRP